MLFSKLDGTGKPARDQQIEYFKHFEKTYKTHRIHGIAAPPGTGKSFIARAIQKELVDTVSVTPNNLLVDQYCETYPELNPMKGKDYYASETEYRKSRTLALESENVFNPLSFYYFYLRAGASLPKPRTIIVDEAHKLGEMLLLTVAKSFDIVQFGIPKELTDRQFADWAKAQAKKLEPFHSDTATGTKATLSNQYEQLKLLSEYLDTHLHEVKIFYERKEDYKKKMKTFITIQPLMMPTGLLDTIFGPKTRMILMSGTLTVPHLKELYPNEDKIDLICFEPGAPRANRLIHYAPIPHASRRDTKAIAQKIRETYDRHNRPNTLVHTTYQMGPELARELKDLRPLFNTKENKAEVLQKFKDSGGLLLGSGMAEGVDLPGDMCRLLMIPLLQYPYRGDQAVMKRLALPNGEFWYGLDTLMTCIQQLGRGVRGGNDACTSVIFDCMFPSIIKQYGEYLTDGFKDSIVWSNPGKTI